MPAKIVDGGNGFLYIHRHSNYREVDTFMSWIFSITYKYGKIITQKSIGGRTWLRSQWRPKIELGKL